MQLIMLIAILLLSKIIILNLFSSEILSITINNPHTYIEEIEDLEKYPKMQKYLFVPDATRKKFEVIFIFLIRFVIYLNMTG